VDTLHCRH